VRVGQADEHTDRHMRMIGGTREAVDRRRPACGALFPSRTSGRSYACGRARPDIRVGDNGRTVAKRLATERALSSGFSLA
jgi:hypothetical protein